MTDTFNKNPDQGATAPNGDPSFSNQNPGDNPGASTEGNPSITAEDLAALQKKSEHAQTHISTLEAEAIEAKAEMVKMQERLDQAAKVEDLLKEKGDSTVDVDDLTNKTLKAVTDAMEAKEIAAKADSNFDIVSNTLTEKYGDKVDEAVKTAAVENDMSFDDMVNLARKNPKLALKLCNVEVQREAPPSQGSINPSAVFNQHQGEGQRPTVNVTELRTDRARVDNWNARMDAYLKTLN